MKWIVQVVERQCAKAQVVDVEWFDERDEAEAFITQYNALPSQCMRAYGPFCLPQEAR